MSRSTDKNPAPAENTIAETVLTGPKVLKQFLSDISNDDNLQKGIVSAIETLYQSGKLNKNSLLRKLEEVRNQSKI